MNILVFDTETTNRILESKKEKRLDNAKNCVNSIIVPIIEKATEMGKYEVYVLKELCKEADVSDCYTILTENGFTITNYRVEFLIEW